MRARVDIVTEIVNNVNLEVKLPEEAFFSDRGDCSFKQFYSCLTLKDSFAAVVSFSKPISKCSQVTAAGLTTATCCKGNPNFDYDKIIA